MDILDESTIFESLPEPKRLLEGFRKLTEKRHLLLKYGKILKRRTFRYAKFKSDSLCYYTSEFSKQKNGIINLHKCIALPMPSPLPSYTSSIKVITHSSANFYLFCADSEELEIMMEYIKLASNKMLQQVLDKMCFSAIDQEFQIINELKTPKASKTENYLTPKNALSRFLFSPVSESNLDPPEENIMIKLPMSISHECHHPIPEADEENLEETLIEIKELYTSTIQLNGNFPVFNHAVLENGSIDEIRELGVRYLWNYQLTNAGKIFESIKGRDLRSHLHCTELCLFRVLITGRKGDIKNTMDELESFQKAQHTLNDPNSEILGAEANLFKAILLVITGQKFKAFINLRNCWKSYKKFEHNANLNGDMKSRVELGLGIFLLIISLAPVSVTTILRLAGFSSNRGEGLQHLFKCYEQSASHSPYAGIILSLYYVDLDPNIEKASEIIESLVPKYPGCVLLHWVNSIISWKNNQLEAAIGYLNKALRCCEPELCSQAAFIKYELGWFYFLRFDWVLAKTQFESILLDTLSLSSELDDLVKHLLQYGSLSSSQTALVHSMSNKKSQKKKKNVNWLESDKTLDRVYLPHKSCLITQLVSCISALSSYDETWLKIIQISSSLSTSHTSLDEDFAGLSRSYINRKSTVLMPYEVIYFMKQHTKLLPHMLVKVFSTATEVIDKIGVAVKENCAEYCSARMLQIMALALNGDTAHAAEICKGVVEVIDMIPAWANYIAPHILYWCARVFIVEDDKVGARGLLKKAKKYKKYIFDISLKIDRVISDLI